MILLVGHYLDPSPARALEIWECLQRNVALPAIEQVHVFLEDLDDVEAARTRCPTLRDPKVRLVRHGRRLRFGDLFTYATRELKDKVVVIANADIFFDSTLALVTPDVTVDRMLCLSRWDVLADGSMKLFARPDSQDAWIFSAPLPAELDGDFELGRMGCDNRVAWAAHAAGLHLANPSRSVHACHLHLTGIRRYDPKARSLARVRRVPLTSMHALWTSSPLRRAALPSREERTMQPYATPRGLLPAGDATSDREQRGAEWLERTFPGLLACVRANDPSPGGSGATAMSRLAGLTLESASEEMTRRAIESSLQAILEAAPQATCLRNYVGGATGGGGTPDQGPQGTLDRLSGVSTGLRGFYARNRGTINTAAGVTAAVLLTGAVIAGGYWLWTMPEVA